MFFVRCIPIIHVVTLASLGGGSCLYGIGILLTAAAGAHLDLPRLPELRRRTRLSPRCLPLHFRFRPPNFHRIVFNSTCVTLLFFITLDHPHPRILRSPLKGCFVQVLHSCRNFSRNSDARSCRLCRKL